METVDLCAKCLKERGFMEAAQEAAMHNGDSFPGTCEGCGHDDRCVAVECEK